MNKRFKYDTLSDFYKDCDNVTDDSDKSGLKRNEKDFNPDFVGLSKDEILANKYTYKKELNISNDLDFDLSGGSKIKKVYSDYDGDDMCYERLINGMPFLQKSVRVSGTGSGKFISIYVNIAESCMVGTNNFLNKAKFVLKLVDYFESIGCRVEVYCCVRAKGVDYYVPGLMSIDICVKSFSDVVTMNALYTAISPWMFRYHIFKLFYVKHKKTDYGLGQPVPFTKEDREKENVIFIDNGECLSENGVKQKLEQVKQLFNI